MGLVTELIFKINEASLREAENKAKEEGQRIGAEIAAGVGQGMSGLAGRVSQAIVAGMSNIGTLIARGLANAGGAISSSVQSLVARIGTMGPVGAAVASSLIAAWNRAAAGISVLRSAIAGLAPLAQTTATLIGAAFNRVGGFVSGAVRRIQDSVGQVRNALTSVQGMLATFGLGASLGGIAKFLVDTNVQYQKLLTQLQTLTGSADLARSAFARMEKFAAETPFSIEQAVQAFIRLRGVGINPTTKDMALLADFASAKGGDIESLVTAATQAAFGETERLKQFHVAARVVGQQITLTYGDMSFKVKRNAQEVVNALLKISEAKFAGAAEREMQTLGGAFSNLSDSVSTLARHIGEAGLNEDIFQITKGITGITSAAAAGDPTMRLWYQNLRDGVSTTLKWIKMLVLGLQAAGEIFAAAGTTFNIWIRTMFEHVRAALDLSERYFNLWADTVGNAARRAANAVIDAMNLIKPGKDIPKFDLVDTEQSRRDIEKARKDSDAWLAELRRRGGEQQKIIDEKNKLADKALEEWRAAFDGMDARMAARNRAAEDDRAFVARIAQSKAIIDQYGSQADAAEKSAKKQTEVEKRMIADVKTARAQLKVELATQQEMLRKQVGQGGIVGAIQAAGTPEADAAMRRIQNLRRMLGDQAGEAPKKPAEPVDPQAEAKRRREIAALIEALRKLDEQGKLTEEDRRRVFALEQQLTVEYGQQLQLKTKESILRRVELDHQLAILHTIQSGTNALLDRSRKTREGLDDTNAKLKLARDLVTELGAGPARPIAAVAPVGPAPSRAAEGRAAPAIIERARAAGIPTAPTAPVAPEKGVPALAPLPIERGQERVNVTEEFARKQEEAARTLAALEQQRQDRLAESRARLYEINIALAAGLDLTEKREVIEKEQADHQKNLAAAVVEDRDRETAAENIRRANRTADIQHLQTQLSEGRNIAQSRTRLVAIEQDIRKDMEATNITAAERNRLEEELRSIQASISAARQREVNYYVSQLEQGKRFGEARVALLEIEKEIQTELANTGDEETGRIRELTADLESVQMVLRSSFAGFGRTLADQFGLIITSAEDAASTVYNSFYDVFSMMRQEGGSMGDVFAQMGKQMAAGLLFGLSRFAFHKALENWVRAKEDLAHASTAMAGAITNPILAVQAAAFFVAAQQHRQAAVAWAALGAAAGVGGAAVAASGGGGGGGGSASPGNGGDRFATDANKRRMTLYLDANLFDPYNRRQVDSLAELMKQAGYADVDIKPLGIGAGR